MTFANSLHKKLKFSTFTKEILNGQLHFCATTVLVFAGVVAAKKLISNFQKVFTQIRRTKMHESEV